MFSTTTGGDLFGIATYVVALRRPDVLDVSNDLTNGNWQGRPPWEDIAKGVISLRLVPFELGPSTSNSQIKISTEPFPVQIGRAVLTNAKGYTIQKTTTNTLFDFGYSDVDDPYDYSNYWYPALKYQTDVKLWLPFYGYADIPADIVYGPNAGQIGLQLGFDIESGHGTWFIWHKTGPASAPVEVLIATYDCMLCYDISLIYRDNTSSISNALTGTIGLAGSIAGTIATNGAAAPILIGTATTAANTILSMRSTPVISGTWGGAYAGRFLQTSPMPYFIIYYPDDSGNNDVDSFINYGFSYGYPTDTFIDCNTLSVEQTTTVYAQFSDCEKLLSPAGMTSEEFDDLVAYLESGIVVNPNIPIPEPDTTNGGTNNV